MPSDGQYQRRTLLKTLGGAGIAGLAGCASGDGGGNQTETTTTTDEPSDGTNTTTTSQLEDSITVYANTAIKPVANAFEEATGVTVNLNVLAGPRALGKFKTEYEADTYNADILINAATQSAWNQEMFAEVPATKPDKVMNDHVESQLKEMNAYGKVWPFYGVIAGFVSNPGTVSNPPTGWEGLLDRDIRMGTPPFNKDNIYAIMLKEWEASHAKDVYPKIIKAMDKFPSNHTVSVQQVISGQLDLAAHIFLRSSLPKNAPVNVSFPSWTSNHVEAVAVSDHAPSPNASEAFVKWLTSMEGQKAVQSYGGGMPAFPDVQHGNDQINAALDEYSPQLYSDVYTKERLTQIQNTAQSLTEGGN